jgi:Ca-activated chloride channel family protein
MSAARSALLVAFLAFVPKEHAHAQQQNPETEVASLAAPRLVIDPDRRPLQDVTISRVAIEAQVIGHLAETRMTLTFSNPNDRTLAGDLVFPLPPGATVSGYALDVAGRMVDGVVVPREEARRVFELEARKGVDPGVVESTRGNVFKTRVFPIPAKGSRTIRLAWVSTLEKRGEDDVYHLPLAFPDRLSEATIRLEVISPDAPARLETSPGLKLAFDTREVAETTLRDRPLVEDLRVVIPSRPTQVLAQTSRSAGFSGDTWFSIRDFAPPPADLAPLSIRRVALVWDASMSRRHADRAREIRLLSTWLRSLGEVEVELTVFRNDVSPVETFALPSRLADLEIRLGGLVPDGATRLDLLPSLLSQSKADAVVVVSDGLETLGRAPDMRLSAPTWFLSSSQVASHAALSAWAAKNGGAFFDLPRTEDKLVLGALGKPVWSLSVEVVGGSVMGLVPLGRTAASGPVQVTGQLTTPEAVLRLSWGLPGQAPQVTRDHRIQRSEASAKGDVLRFASAQALLADLSADPKGNAEAIQHLGRAHGIVTPGTSLLVLETLELYLEHEIEPPASWPEMHAEWKAARRGLAKSRARDAQSKLDKVAKAWMEEVRWYRTHYNPSKKRVESVERMVVLGAGGSGYGDARSEATARPPGGRATETYDESAKTDSQEDHAGGERPEAQISIQPWDPDVPWIRALKAETKNLEARYFVLRDEHGDAPSFYLDVAEFFLTRGDRALGLRVLSNLAELRLDEPALLRVLGHRFAQVDELDLAIFVFEQVLELRPEEPQSYRDLALVLGRRGLERKSRGGRYNEDLDRSVKLLSEVVKRPWDRFEDIEVMALYELNRLVALAPAGSLGALPLDSRFITPMPLDIRITMSWDADLTDMDIHVIDPRNEEASYSNSLTEIGGRVSKDFTEGYGPETFSLRKAIPGAYEVKTRFYASNAISVAGSVTLQVEVVTNWGRPNEKREAMTLRLTEAKEDFVVGKIVF